MPLIRIVTRENKFYVRSIGLRGIQGEQGPQGPVGPQGPPGPGGGGGGAVDSVNGQTGVVVLDKSDIGLENVDNTSDLDKPISTATQSELDNKVNSGDLADVATSGDYDDLDNKPTIPDTSGLVPNTRTVNGQPLSSDVSLDKSDVGLENVDNTSDANKPVSTATQSALDDKYDASNPSGFTDYDSSDFDSDLATKTTDNIVEGVTNLYTQWANTANGIQSNVSVGLGTAPSAGIPLTTRHASNNINRFQTSAIDTRLLINNSDAAASLYTTTNHPVRLGANNKKDIVTVRSDERVDFSGRIQLQENITHAANEAVTRSRIDRFYVDCLDFGADPTGATDSRVAIQTALNFVASEGGGTCYLPDGTYSVSRTGVNAILVPNNVLFRGAGMDNTTIIGAADATAYHVINAGGNEFVQISDMTIDGNRDNVQQGGHTVNLSGCNTVIVERLRILRSTVYGIGMQGSGGRNIVIRDIYGEDMGRELLDIKNNQNTNANILVDNVNCKNWNLLDSGTEGCIDVRGRNVVVTNCTILHDRETQVTGAIGIRLRPGLESDSNGGGAWNSFIHNCSVDFTGTRSISHTRDFWGIQAQSPGALVTNNQVRAAQKGIVLNCSYSLASGNNVIDASQSHYFIRKPHGSAHLYPTITHNILSNNLARTETVYTGTFTAGTSTTADLPDEPEFNQANRYFVTFTVEITAGTGAGQVRRVSGFTASNRRITASGGWDVTPDATSQFKMARVGVVLECEGDYTTISNITARGADFTGIPAFQFASNSSNNVLHPSYMLENYDIDIEDNGTDNEFPEYSQFSEGVGGINANRRVGIYTNEPLARHHVTTGAAIVGQIIQGGALQTANLSEWRNSDGDVRARITASGDIETQFTSGKVLIGQFFGFPLVGLWNNPADTQGQVYLFTASLGGVLGVSGPGIALGSGGAASPDVLFYRSAASTLRTNSSLIVDGNILGNTIQASVNSASTDSNISIDFKEQELFTLTLQDDITVTLTDGVASTTQRATLKVAQDATGGREITWAGNVKFPSDSAPVLSSDANNEDILEFIWDGTNWNLTNFVSSLS